MEEGVTSPDQQPAGADAEPTRGWRLAASITSQVDGLLFAMLGVRLERDVLACCGAESQCVEFGLGRGESCASMVGLYVGELEEMERCVLRAVEQHACGVFVIPHERVKQPKHVWEQALAKSMLLRFELPRDALVGAGWSTELCEPLWAVMASFDFAGRFKAKRRKERSEPGEDPRVGRGRVQGAAAPRVTTGGWEGPDAGG